MIAKALAAWVSGEGRKILEPSCGGGALLVHLEEAAPGREIVGVELAPSHAARAAENAPSARVVADDFFRWFSPAEERRWDAVVANPPYQRYAHWDADSRSRAFELMRRLGYSPRHLTNAWAAFVAAAIAALRDNGRLALLLPTDLLSVDYAGELRKALAENFEQLHLITFSGVVFPDLRQDVLILLAAGNGHGPATLASHQVESVEDPTPLVRRIRSRHRPSGLTPAGSAKWNHYLLPRRDALLLNRILSSGALCRLSDLARVSTGVLTGNDGFFIVEPSLARAYRIEQHTRPIITGASALTGPAVTGEDIRRLERLDQPHLLIDATPTSSARPDPQLAAYLQEGEKTGVAAGSKCASRKRWWAVPAPWQPDAFLTRHCWDAPRIFANATKATSTVSLHRLLMRDGISPHALAVGAFNSLTLLSAELEGRSYGHGVLELGVKEAQRLLIPPLTPLRNGDLDIIGIHLAAGDAEAALHAGDRLLLKRGLGLSSAEVAALRETWRDFRRRRQLRWRRGRPEI